GGVFYPLWSDNSAALGNNPNLPKLDIATARVVVNPGPAVTQLALSGLAPAPAAGTPQGITVTAQDAFDNTATGYSGTVHFTSSDGQATLPADGTLAGGVGTFLATLKTAGNQTLTATDTVTGSITGTSAPIAVSPAVATRITVTAPVSTT